MTPTPIGHPTRTILAARVDRRYREDTEANVARAILGEWKTTDGRTLQLRMSGDALFLETEVAGTDDPRRSIAVLLTPEMTEELAVALWRGLKETDPRW